MVNRNRIKYDAHAALEVRMSDQLATQWVRGTIRAEMNRRNLSYADLAQRLSEIGVEENERNLRNKVARGTFGAVFFVQCLEAIGLTSLKLDMLEFIGSPARKPDHAEEFYKPLTEAEYREMQDTLARVRAHLDEK
ncbi:MAG: DUF6471 domain-containing protein [Phenylobacterium sp.]|nr:DUF6471 domain-containing protein [Phenylobacterium sp.]